MVFYSAEQSEEGRGTYRMMLVENSEHVSYKLVVLLAKKSYYTATTASANVHSAQLFKVFQCLLAVKSEPLNSHKLMISGEPFAKFYFILFWKGGC